MRSNTNPLPLAIILLPLALLLSACAAPTDIPTQATVGPTATELPSEAVPTENATPTQTAAPAQTQEDSAGQDPASATFDVSGLAQGVLSDVIAAVPPGIDGPWWEMMPQHTRLTLQGYPIASHKLAPQIFIYPVEGLSVSEFASQAAEDLQTLLQDQQGGQSMPYLPPYNEMQMMHALTSYLDFKNGKGVRFLTEYGQGPVPVNNRELLYTFQGLTADGKYYVAVVLPVNLTGLPADGTLTGDLSSDYTENYAEYMADTVEMLEKQPASAYTPNLSALDTLVQSIEIN